MSKPEGWKQDNRRHYEAKVYGKASSSERPVNPIYPKQYANKTQKQKFAWMMKNGLTEEDYQYVYIRLPKQYGGDTKEGIKALVLMKSYWSPKDLDRNSTDRRLFIRRWFMVPSDAKKFQGRMFTMDYTPEDYPLYQGMRKFPSFSSLSKDIQKAIIETGEMTKSARERGRPTNARSEIDSSKIEHHVTWKSAGVPYLHSYNIDDLYEKED